MIRDRRVLAGCLLLACLASPKPSLGQELSINSPTPVPTFGEVRFSFSTETALAEAQFYIDGDMVGERKEPPWTIIVDVGQDNLDREFSVEAATKDGRRLRMTLTTPAIRVDEELTVELQQLYVTVTRNGRRVTDLTQESFTVLDQGTRQELVTFVGGNIPLVAALLVDGSASMAGEPLNAGLLGARSFTDDLAELDQASVSIFADHLLHQTPWSNFAERKDELHTLLESVEAAGNTAVWDMLYRALGQLEARQGRRVVVLLSDGADLSSVLNMDDVAWKARRSAAMIYWLRLEGASGGSYRTVWRGPEENRKHHSLLEKIVKQSGGRVIEVAESKAVPAAFQEVMSELREQYALGYYPNGLRSDGSWRDVRVLIRGDGFSSRSRTGYVDW